MHFSLFLPQKQSLINIIIILCGIKTETHTHARARTHTYIHIYAHNCCEDSVILSIVLQQTNIYTQIHTHIYNSPFTDPLSFSLLLYHCIKSRNATPVFLCFCDEMHRSAPLARHDIGDTNTLRLHVSRDNNLK